MFKYALATAGLALALLVPAAQAATNQSEPWPSDGQNTFNTRYGGNAGPTGSRATKDLVPVWARTFDSPVVGTPIISSATGGIYFSTENGEVWAIRRKDGVKYWEQFVNGQVEGSVLKGPNFVYVVASTAKGPYLTALDPYTGDIKWSTQLDSNPNADSCGGPQYSAAHDAVIVGLGACRADRSHTASNVRGGVASVNATTGAGNWKTFTVSPLAKGGGVSATPIVWDAGDKVFLTTGPAYGSVADPNTDSFLRLNLTTGVIDGHFEVNADDTTSNTTVDPGKRVGFSTSSPLAFTAKDHNSYLGAGAGDGKFYIVDPLTMTNLRSATLSGPSDVTGIASSASFDPTTQQIVGVSQSPALYFGINQADASVAWAFPGTDVLHRGPVSIADNAIWSTDELGFADVQNRSDGHLLGRFNIGSPSTGGVSFQKDTAYVAVGVPNGLIPNAPNSGAVYALK
jgi:outer membrane protein assembly factor BamB